MADTFTDLPEGWDQTIPIMALSFMWLSRQQTKNDLLGSLLPDIQHHSCLKCVC